MIKLFIFLIGLVIFIAFAIATVYGLMLESKIKFADELIKRGADISEVVRRL